MRIVWAALAAVFMWASVCPAAELPEVPVKGMVTMVDLGAKSCVPCKMMQPVLAAVEKKYQGRAAVLFIDVWENRDQGQRYALRAIPTQIFYDRTGKETQRHEGYLDEPSIARILDALLAE
jgi:thioredoxin 1